MSKLILPIAFDKLGKFLYIDDDVVLLKNPAKLIDSYDYCHNRERVFVRFCGNENGTEFVAYQSIFSDCKMTSPKDFNLNVINSGVFVYTCRDLEKYVYYLKRFLENEHIKFRFDNGFTFYDEKFLTYWFRRMGSKFIPQTVSQLCNSDFSFKKVRTELPFTCHFATCDRVRPDYVDYFSSVENINGEMLVSKYATKKDFINREKVNHFQMRKFMHDDKFVRKEKYGTV
jgi:hypothetical protein